MPLVHFSKWYQIIFRYSLLHLPKRISKVVFLKEHVFFPIHTRPFFKVFIFFLQELWMPGTFASFISFVASQIWGRPRKYSTASEPANSSSFSYRAVYRTHVYRAVHRTHVYRAVHRTLITLLWTLSDRRHNQSFRNCFPGRWMWRLEALPIWLLGQFIVVFETTWTMCLSSNKTSYSCNVFNHIL